LLLFLVLGDLLGVTALRLRVGEPFDFDELRAQALHLLLDGLAHVESLDDRAQASRRGNGLQAGDAGPEHQHLGGRDGARRGHQHGEELGQSHGGQQDAVVAGGRRLRAQHVHALGERGARDHVGRDGGHTARRERPHEIGVGERIEEAYERRPFAELADLLLRGRMDLNDDVRLGEQLIDRRLDRGAGGAIFVVPHEGALTRVGLDAHVDLLGDEALDGVGDEGNPRLAGGILFGYRESHGPFRDGGGLGSRRRLKPGRRSVALRAVPDTRPHPQAP